MAKPYSEDLRARGPSLRRLSRVCRCRNLVSPTLGTTRIMTPDTSWKSLVRESRLPGSVRAKPNGLATRPRSRDQLNSPPSQIPYTPVDLKKSHGNLTPKVLQFLTSI
jgi:hypothetical protein